MSGFRIPHRRGLVCFLVLFLISKKTEGTEGACSVSPLQWVFCYIFIPSVLLPWLFILLTVCLQLLFFFFFLISTMSDFSRKAKEQSMCRINPFCTHLFNTSFNALFQKSCLQSLVFIYHSHYRESGSITVQ